VTWSQYAQVAIAVGCLVYAAILIGQRLRGRLTRRERTPVDDLRLVIDLAARLRDQRKTDAVAVCQRLLDELLKPEAPQS
jgi:hypothetical protein